ncbi:hypothetical protein V8C44DRAFT_339981 [Trichoderma aethiopicum]
MRCPHANPTPMASLSSSLSLSFALPPARGPQHLAILLSPLTGQTSRLRSSTAVQRRRRKTVCAACSWTDPSRANVTFSEQSGGSVGPRMYRKQCRTALLDQASQASRRS